MRIVKSIMCILLCLLLLLPCTVSATDIAFEWEVSKEQLLASLWEADITSIHKAYEMGWITCTELTEYYLERIEEYNDTYNCFITLCDDVLEYAAKCDEAIAAGNWEGKLFGIPLVIKDNMDYAGYHTTNGYSKKSSQIAKSNAQIVDYILEEGAIIIGKTNMSTAAQDARASSSQAVGETKNAYNSELASGGSSGGSAVATSLNFAVAGLGTDTNSSLRLPAALNGCISLRVTWDTLSVDGIKKLNSTRDVPGVITRTVMDQAIILDVLSGGETNYAENLNSEVLNGLKIGVLKELSYAIGGERTESNISDEVAAAFANAITELEDCGVEIVEVSIPNVLSLASVTLNSNKSSDKEKMYKTIQKAMEENQVSALIFPTYLTKPLRSGRDSNGKNWSVWNQTFINNTSKFSSCASLPEIAVPIGYHSRGAAIGMEIAALKNQEQLLLDIAYAYTERYDHRAAPSNAPDLYAGYNVGTLSQVIDSYYTAVADYEEAVRLAEEEAARKAEEEAKRLEEEERRLAEEEAARIAAEEAARQKELERQRLEQEAAERMAELNQWLLLLALLLVAFFVFLIILIVRIRRSKRKRYSTVY